MLHATGLLLSAAGGVLAAALVPPAAEAPGWREIECPGCQVSDNPSPNPGPHIVLTFDAVTKTAGTCVPNEATEDPDDCKPGAKCKLGGAIGITNNAPDTDPPSVWQLNNATTGESVALPGNGEFTAVPLAGTEFPCSGNVTFTVTRQDGNPPGSIATWSWSCPSCPLSVD